jgi:hypothetical protein
MLSLIVEYHRGSAGVITPFLTDAKSRDHAAFSICFGGKPPFGFCRKVNYEGKTKMIVGTYPVTARE